jgi:cytochrome c peroxidase
MTAPTPTPAQADALAHWIDRQPVLHAAPVDAAAVTRGQALFESEAVGCNKCHTGARLSSNQSADVGTGVFVQVPSLRAVSFRAPFMHDGCARTLSDRFTTCGGGDKHGHTSQLQATQIQDLVAYLESL